MSRDIAGAFQFHPSPVHDPELSEAIPAVFCLHFRGLLQEAIQIASCKYCSDLLIDQGKLVEFDDLPGRGVSAFVAFVVLAIILGFVFVFRQQLGLMDVLTAGGVGAS